MKAKVILGACVVLLSSCHTREIPEGTKETRDSFPVIHKSPGADAQWRSANCVVQDSVDITYVEYACDCPNWVRGDSMESNKSKQVPDTIVPFINTINNSYYIEPGGANDTIDKMKTRGMRVMLYGRIDSTLRYPKNADFMDPDPPKGRVFIYCGYKIIDYGLK